MSGAFFARKGEGKSQTDIAVFKQRIVVVKDHHDGAGRRIGNGAHILAGRETGNVVKIGNAERVNRAVVQHVVARDLFRDDIIGGVLQLDGRGVPVLFIFGQAQSAVVHPFVEDEGPAAQHGLRFAAIAVGPFLIIVLAQRVKGQGVEQSGANVFQRDLQRQIVDSLDAQLRDVLFTRDDGLEVFDHIHIGGVRIAGRGGGAHAQGISIVLGRHLLAVVPVVFTQVEGPGQAVL